MATHDQTIVTAALEDLKLEFVPPEEDPPKVGGPVTFRVTDATLEFLKGKTVTVDSDAKIVAE